MQTANKNINATKGVRILTGDPRKAIVKLSVPMIIAMLIQTLYNIIDGIWVAGLGSDELAAIGLFFPLFMIIISLASGISIGGSAAISRKIGAKDKDMADSAAIHTLLLGLSTAVVLTLITFPFIHKIFQFTGTNTRVVTLVTGYGKIITGFSFFLIFNNIAAGILRGEGDTKRVMYAMMIGSILNIILDPIFIYGFKLGINGAAWATVFSFFTTSTLLFYWLFVKKNTFVNFNFRRFKLNGGIIKEILRVGIPSSLAQMAMALAIFALNYLIVKVDSTDGVAIFTSTWRIIMIALVPLHGIAAGLTAVIGASYGSKNIENLKKGYFFGIKLGIIIEFGMVLLFFIFAAQISYLFSYSEKTAQISYGLTTTLRQLIWFLPAVPLGRFTSAMFQGIGKGEKSLALTLIRTIFFQVLFAYLLGWFLNYGMPGICWGVVTGNIIASFIGVAWGNYEIKKMIKVFTK